MFPSHDPAGSSGGGSQPQTLIWSGSAFAVTAADILADTGFVVVPGIYTVKHSGNTELYNITVASLTQTQANIVSVEPDAGQLRADKLQFLSTSTFIMQLIEGDTTITSRSLTEIYYTKF